MDDRDDTVTFGLDHDIDTLGVVVSVSGEIDLLTAPALAGVLRALLDDGRRRIVVDLAQCELFGAQGVEVLADVARRAAVLGGVVIVASASAQVRRMLEITRVGDLVDVVEAASTELAKAGPAGRSTPQGTAASTTGATSVAWRSMPPRSSTDVVDAALRLVTALAESTVTNADGVSVTLERHGRLTTVAASNDKVLTMDRHQYETGEGPCLEARAQDRWFYIESLADETRWPKFVPLALEQGIHSILSSPLKTSEHAQGALNIYSATTQAFGRNEQELAALFADQASRLLTAAAPDPTDAVHARRFTAALTARQIIHQAQGIAMAREGMTANEALGWLFRSARTANTTVLEFAVELTGSPHPDVGVS